MSERRYSISTWHGDPIDVASGAASAVGIPGVCGCSNAACKGGWHQDHADLRLWELRSPLRALYARGWSNMTILVQSEVRDEK